MPIDLNLANSASIVSGHDHCQEVVSASHHDGDKSSIGSSSNPTHYCCAVVAVLMGSPEFSISQQLESYVLINSVKPISNIAESIYKPPKNYL